MYSQYHFYTSSFDGKKKIEKRINGEHKNNKDNFVYVEKVNDKIVKSIKSKNPEKLLKYLNKSK